jgi:hypothetical protein
MVKQTNRIIDCVYLVSIKQNKNKKVQKYLLNILQRCTIAINIAFKLSQIIMLHKYLVFFFFRFSFVKNFKLISIIN